MLDKDEGTWNSNSNQVEVTEGMELYLKSEYIYQREFEKLKLSKESHNAPKLQHGDSI
jgi:hypothetical protein